MLSDKLGYFKTHQFTCTKQKKEPVHIRPVPGPSTWR